MSTRICAPPEEIGPTPEFSLDFKAYEAAEDAYIQRVADYAKKTNPFDPYAGKLNAYPIAGGYAQYVILKA